MHVTWWMPSSFTGGLLACALDRFGDPAALEAARADVGTGRRTVEQDPDPLQVGLEASLGGDHGVAPVVAETRLLCTDPADSGHADNPFRTERRQYSPQPARGTARHMDDAPGTADRRSRAWQGGGRNHAHPPGGRAASAAH